MRRALGVLGRLARVLAHCLHGLYIVLRVLPHLAVRARQARVQRWEHDLVRLLGVALEVHGTPPAQGPVLLVANHMSWLDIPVLHASGYCRFVSKAEVRRWPLIGALAAGAGTLFIERTSRRDALRVVHYMAERLAGGDVLAIFPEGTTTDGSGVLPFHANLLQAALAADAPVQPVALRYVDAETGAVSTQAAYIDDDTLVGSIWRALAGRPLKAVVTYGTAQRADGRSRRVFAHDLHTALTALRETPLPARRRDRQDV